MTTVLLTKRKVIDILKKEPLTHRTYGSDTYDDYDGPANRKSCSFCAVGQVVRACMSTTATLDRVQGLAVYNAENNRVLRSLEGAFEAEDDKHDHDGEKGRKAAIAYVRKHFPEVVEVDIGDAKPRRGMKVVK